uniref:Triadin n=1 Tax=Athene cunicularia TaxID=194338 RepID=A0A663LZW7_ATHCN
QYFLILCELFFSNIQLYSFLVIQKDKPERHVKAEKKPPPKAEEKKVKSTKVEIKVKKEVKDGKGEAKTTEKVKQAETKTTEVGLIKAKPKVKEEKALQTVTKSEKKDQYAFCRYVIDMFAQGDFYPGHKELVPPPLLLEHSPRKKPLAIEGKFVFFLLNWLLLINLTLCSDGFC